MNHIINEAIDEIEEDLDTLKNVLEFIGFKNSLLTVKHIRFNLSVISDEYESILSTKEEDFIKELKDKLGKAKGV